MRTFVSIASYCDPVLAFTLQRALATARWPDALHFGVVNQLPAGSPRLGRLPGAARLSEVQLEARDARGPCWARALAMTLYDGEDWFLQLDSHMDFDASWDERLADQARELLPGRRGVVVSSYPNAFAFAGREVVRKPTTQGVLAHVVQPGAAFTDDHPVLPFEAHPVASERPVPGYHLGAGCLFAPGAFVQLFPYDPWFYFHGEEQALALRLFTHGWDLFHMPGLPVHHLYNNPDSGAPARPMHWDSTHEAEREVSWWAREQVSRQRLALLAAGAPLGVYGLGSVRSIADYAAFCGIDYRNRTLSPAAHRPLVPLAPTPLPAGSPRLS
jgi:hypothetical protein